MNRRKFLGLLPLVVIATVGVICGDKTKKRNKKLKRTGEDRLEPGNGKGWDDKK